MNKFLLISLIAILLAPFCPKSSMAAPTSSQEFKIVVYIPAIPGINAPLDKLTEDVRVDGMTGTSFYVTTEELQEDGQKVFRETIVAR
ncbi:MAG TPA: hypothetical protein PLB05_09355 [Candidatus Omnitrophota bacterium]|nr:hypothetical protein [Candidatus Omnitrophota bacterium]HPN56470.1 hypothetical protein [Candidatus Omnitrophota bacterium]